METQISEKAILNDKFRKYCLGYMMTPGIAALGDIVAVTEAVRAYDNFIEDNDPYGEHDFGSLELFGVKIFWKIDYYNSSLQSYCDPLEKSCVRVLTVMLAEEY